MTKKRAQSNLFDDPKEKQEKKIVKPVFSVGEFLDYINAIFKGEEYSVVGEISEFKNHPSGVYFSLKDAEAEGVLNCYMNPYAYRMLGIPLDDGIVVKAIGTPNVYKPKGRLSFVVRTMELEGEGSLKKAYELLKKKLEAEGLFARKRPIPECIREIGIITSKSGAVIDDFRKNLKPLGMKLRLFDVRVEGPSAPRSIIQGIRWFQKETPQCDVIVLIRGGGSLKDLQAFNNELVARELFASSIPVIAGIGHDRDIPIASLVSDVMTSTPSFAAMTVNASWDRVLLGLPEFERNLFNSFENAVRELKMDITGHAEHLLGKLSHLVVRYKILEDAMLRVFALRLREIDEFLKRAAQYLAAVDPERNLRLGYSIIFSDEGKVVRDAAEVREGKVITARLHRGSLRARVERTEQQ